MIQKVTGDILLSKAQAIAHGVAPFDDFKQGLALALRERWPALYNDFRHFCHTQNPKEGELWSWKGAGSSIIVNLLTQGAPPRPGQHPGRAQITAVNHSLRELAKMIQKEGIKSVAITKLATGVGGLEWKDVEPLIEKHLGALGIEVVVYEEYRAGVAADENLKH
jgi:O-acetyl-ADP-ribose deacetylase (regulator of RNase III)